MTTSRPTPAALSTMPLSRSLIAVAMAAACWSPLRAAEGDLDPAFGSGGAYPANAIVYEGMMLPRVSGAGSMSRTSDGKILLSGHHARSSRRDYHDIFHGVLTRLAADGTYDTSFGGDGRVLVPGPTGGPTYIESVLSLPGGKTAALLVALNGANALASRHIVRLNPDGTIDTSFAQSGYASVGVEPAVAWEFDSTLSIDPQGRFLVWGYIGSAPVFHARVTRYTAAGALDTGWASNGSLAPGLKFATAIAFDAAGDYLIASADLEAASADTAQIAKFSAANGTLVSGFGSNGKMTISGSSVSRLIVAAPWLYALGVKDNVSPARPEVRRLSLATGAADAGWNGGAPMSLTAFGAATANSAMTLHDACLLGDGRLLVSATKSLDGQSLTQIVAVAANGSGHSLYYDLGAESELSAASASLITLGSGANERLAVANMRRVPGTGRDGNRIRVTTLRTSDAALDTAFSGDGLADVSYQTPTLDQALAAFAGPDGTTYTVINAHMTANEGSTLGVPLDSRRYFAVVRQRADGLKDSLFGSGGTASLSLASDGSDGALRHGAPAADGGIVVATELRLFRFTPGGTRDMAFGGGDGVAQSSNAGDRIQRLLVQPDGKILALGRNTFTNLVILRFNANGTLDSGFGSGGRRVIAGNSPGDLALQSDGRVLALAAQSIGGSSTPVVIRLTAAGAVDTTWGTAGSVALPKAGYSTGAHTRLIAVPSGGWIALGSLVTPPIERRAAVWRIAADGSMVSGFGSGGLAVFNIAPMASNHQIETERFTNGLVDATRGLLYLTGDSERTLLDASSLPDGSESRAWVARLNLTTGALDNGFASNGLRIWDTQNYPDTFPANRPMALTAVLPSGDSGRLRLVGDLREDTVLLRMLVGNVQVAAAPVIAQGAQASVTMSEDGSPTPFNLTLGASDADSPDLSWTVAEQPAHGSVTIGASASGAVANPVYVPDPDWHGTDSFVLVVSDGFLTDSIRVDVTVDPVVDTVGGTPDVAISVLDAIRSDGATVAAGNAVVGAAPLSVPIRIANAGTANLVLLSTTLGSQINCSASLVGAPPVALAPGAGSTFAVAISPAATGAWSCVLVVAAQDPDEPTTTITISGQGLAASAPVVTIAATDGVASEGTGAPDTATVVLTRSGSTAAALTVNLGVGGSTATAGADYSVSPAGSTGSATFPAGAATVTITFTAVDDATAEGEELIRLNVLSGSGYAPGAVASADVAIIDNDSAGADGFITIAATDAAAAEVASGAANGGLFTLTRSGSTAAALTVNLTATGSATAGSDYTAIPATASFAAGSATTTIAVTVIDDTSIEGPETVVLSVDSSANYTIGSPASATVTITDNEVAPSITIAATDAAAAEVASGTANGGLFTVTRSGSTAAALTVNLAATGSATAGSDYTAIPATVTFAAGSATATIAVAVIDDLATEGSETVVASVQAGSGYTLGSPASASVTIADNEAGGSGGGSSNGGGGGGGGGCGAGAMAGLLALIGFRLRRRRG